MFSSTKHNPTGRFDGLASTYARYRPDYPPPALDWIIELLPNRHGTIVDIGCGTGISTRQLAARGVRVVGVEPNDSMRAEAEATSVGVAIEYRAGRAEATGLESGCADAVVAAQAFHWFDAAAALREIHRLLKPNGWLTLLWNDFDLSDPFTAAYWRLMQESTPEPEVVAEPHHVAGKVLFDHVLVEDAHIRTCPHSQELDENGLLGRAFSASFAPKERGAAERFANRLRAFVRDHARSGKVRLMYQTTLYQARKAP